ncbi:hypothetical protein DT076_11100 [Desertihabitans brevis]|uniref:Cytoplasmic protein n=1 Tax=Desertihabitans brevis TaxID=2268447 RepID=A0A367YU92_9ACTN|nr:MSMEG_6728 family protein [Desertihabitans brevis]RCK69424.1 hypothetical protein DT076_11100 [Desertihabitans brevis]
MQTFLPYADFTASARVLDVKRLGKQRVETLQVMRALTIEGYGWRHHRVAKMWTWRRPSLLAYQLAVCTEWRARGFTDTCWDSTLAEISRPSLADPDSNDLLLWEQHDFPAPVWLGREEIHRSHRSKLVSKDPAHYRPLFPDVPDDLEYVWPQAER